MWTELVGDMWRFRDGVLTGLDTTGHPLGLRCRFRPDHLRRELRCPRPPGVDLVDGPASVLWHSHDARLWTLRSFVARGELRTAAGELVFTPRSLVPGAGLAGPLGDARAFLAARRRARRHLRRHRIPRPKVPWSRLRHRPGDDGC